MLFHCRNRDLNSVIGWILISPCSGRTTFKKYRNIWVRVAVLKMSNGLKTLTILFQHYHPLISFKSLFQNFRKNMSLAGVFEMNTILAIVKPTHGGQCPAMSQLEMFMLGFQYRFLSSKYIILKICKALVQHFMLS